MAGRISMYVLLICSLATDGLLVVVSAQPTVSAMILTPEADRKEGGRVDMKCTATNLESDHIVAWGTEGPDVVLRLGRTTVTTDSRFLFNTQEDTVNEMTIQDLTITNVQRDDSERYFCKVYPPNQDGGSDVVAVSSVTLSVFYAPNASFPMCIPAGPITVENGTGLNMRCTSESGNRAVRMTITPAVTAGYPQWASQIVDETDLLVRTSDLTATVADDGVAFECTITSTAFRDMLRSCTIGPIAVIRNTAMSTTRDPATSSTPTPEEPITSTSTEFTKPDTFTDINPETVSMTKYTTISQSLTSHASTGVTNTQTLCLTHMPPSTTQIWITALIASLVFNVILVIIIVILIVCVVRKTRLIKRSRVAREDPYVEMQPGEDTNRVYNTRIPRAANTIQHTYYRRGEDVKESPVNDNNRSQESTNTSHVVDRVPCTSDGGGIRMFTT